MVIRALVWSWFSSSTPNRFWRPDAGKSPRRILHLRAPPRMRRRTHMRRLPAADKPRRAPRYLSAASRGMDLSRNLFGSASAVLADAASTMRS